VFAMLSQDQSRFAAGQGECPFGRERADFVATSEIRAFVLRAGLQIFERTLVSWVLRSGRERSSRVRLVRISVQLIDAIMDGDRWADRYHRNLLIYLQDEIAQKCCDIPCGACEQRERGASRGPICVSTPLARQSVGDIWVRHFLVLRRNSEAIPPLREFVLRSVWRCMVIPANSLRRGARQLNCCELALTLKRPRDALS